MEALAICSLAHTAITHLLAKTVGQLRELDAWPDNLVLSVPEQHGNASCVKIGKVNVKGRVSPKP